MPMTIGIDLDNTLITYDKAFHELATASGWVDHDMVVSKSHIRDMIRRLEDGETKWQQLQAQVYGSEIYRAEPMEGVIAFLKCCREQGHHCFVISHKSRYAAADPGGCDLRESALAWLDEHGFFSIEETGLDQGRVFFADNRAEKLAKIEALQCDCFIDDLPEVLLEPDFPVRTKKLWFAPDDQQDVAGLMRFNHWKQISEHVC